MLATTAWPKLRSTNTPVCKKPPAREIAGRRQGVEEWIGKHPVVCVGTAIVIGVALGWLIKRV